MTRGERIRYLREQVLDLTQEELAERLGVSRGAVGNWESGGNIGAKNLLALAKMSGSSAEWIESGGGETPAAVDQQRRKEDDEVERSRALYLEKRARIDAKQMARIRETVKRDYGVDLPEEIKTIDDWLRYAPIIMGENRREEHREERQLQASGAIRLFTKSGTTGGNNIRRRVDLPEKAESLDHLTNQELVDMARLYQDPKYAMAYIDRIKGVVDGDGEERRVPKDGIKELDAAAGMGGGQTVPEAYRAGESGYDVVDAFKPEAWIFPSKFTESLGAPVSKILAITTQGESMAPTIHHGDVVFIDTTHCRISPPGLYAMRDIYGEVIVKRLDVFRRGEDVILRITSDNPHEPGREERAEEVAIVGRVCGIMKRV